MGFLGAIASGLSAVGSFIGGCASKLGSSICGIVGGLLSPFPQLGIAITVIKVVGEIIKIIAEGLGIIKEEDQIDELGAKAMQEDTLGRDAFKSEQEYIEYLKNEVALDREKFEKASPEEKLAYAAVGVSIVSKSVEEKTGIGIPPEFLLTAAKTKMSVEEVSAYIEKFKEKGFETLGVISSYLKGEDMKGDESTISSTIMEGLQQANPDMNQEQIQDRLVDMIVGSKEER